VSNYIIIFCCRNDEHAERVKACISSKFEVISLEREEYGKSWSIACSIAKNGICVVITFNNIKIDNNNVHSVYLRRDFTIESQDIIGDFTEAEKRYISAQRTIHVNSCIKLLSQIKPCINTPESNFACLSKVLQIYMARNVGLKVPPSFFGGLIENRFLNLDERLCIKPLEGIHIKEGDKTYAHYAEILEDKSVEALKTLEFCPAIIQNYINKIYELRVTIVGDKIFTCRIESQKSKIGNIDWRHHDWENTPHYKDDLPNHVKLKLLKLMQNLNLSYGAVDMIFDGNEYYFLEINSMGQWLWIEDLTDMPISQAIADLLIQIN